MPQTQSKPPETESGYQLWVNEKRTVMARLWFTGGMEIATRRDPRDVWGPPVLLTEDES